MPCAYMEGNASLFPVYVRNAWMPLVQDVRNTDDLNTELVEKAMNYGNVAGWLCVQKKGAMESLPCTEEIEKILRETI